MSNRLDQDREQRLQPVRMRQAKDKIQALGIEVTEVGATELRFMFRGHLVKFYPYSGWHTGKSIQDGRGFKHLYDQLNITISGQ